MPQLKPIAEAGHLTIDGSTIAYTVYHSARRRRTLALYVDAADKIRLIVPMRTSPESIQRILDDRRYWLARRLAELREANGGFLSPREFENGAQLSYLGAPRTLHITCDPLSPIGCYAADGQLHLNVHAANEAAAKEDARLEIQLWYKKKAKEILKQRTDYWSAKLGLTYRSLKIVNPSRQWGSCSSANDIRYNWRIVMAAQEVIDYLVVHELCHIAHKNHSRRFWNLLASAIPDWRLYRKQLRCLDPAFVF